MTNSTKINQRLEGVVDGGVVRGFFNLYLEVAIVKVTINVCDWKV